MKRRCYERGAEDNLTAVVIQIGTPQYVATFDAERTVDAKAPELARTAPDVPAAAAAPALTPASRIAFPSPASEAVPSPVVVAQKPASKVGRTVRRFFGFIFVVALVAAAFYAGMRYREIREFVGGTVSSVQPAASPTPDTAAAFAAKRAAVDSDPQKWLAENVPAGSKPFDSKDPEFLYLYGRAQMRAGNQTDAAQAFDLAIANYQSVSAAPLPLSAEVKLAQAAAALKQGSATGIPSQDALAGQQKAAAILDELLGMKGQSAPK